MSWSLKIDIWLHWVNKTYRFLVTSGVFFLEKYDELSKSVAFGLKLRYFTDRPEWTKGGTI